MYLKQSHRKDGRGHLSICQNYSKGGKNKTKTYKSLGYLDQYDGDPEETLERFRKEAASMEEAYRAEHAPVTLSLSVDKKIDKRTQNRKDLGYAVPSAYYHTLGVHTFWHNRQVKRGFAYDANAIFRLLVFSQIFSPGSKLSAFTGKERLFLRSEFSLDDMYRALTFFNEYKDDLIKKVNEGISAMRTRDISKSYYDATNYYFEIDEEDGLRRLGACKEHRPNPIVAMGLLMDADGIPLTYRLYPGNTNDALTLRPILKQMRRDYSLGRTVIVADKGNNTSDNIAANILDGMGYVYSQTVRGGDKELKSWVLAQEGYRVSEDFKVKSRQAYKTVSVEGDDGKAHRVRVEIRQVAFWSADYDARAKAERAAVLRKSKRLAESKAAYDNAKTYGAARYVKETVVDKETGEIKDTVRALNADKIEEDERYDGYYCIITSETEWTDDQVIECYRGLWRIEETFRVTKSDLKCRPVYVSRQDHIEAHFLICYVALVLLRLLQADTAWRYSVKTIVAELSQIQCSHLKENWWHFDYRSDITDELCALAGIDLSKEILSLAQIKKTLADTKKPKAPGQQRKGGGQKLEDEPAKRR